MAEPAPGQQQGWTARADQPLIAVPSVVDGVEIVHYFTSEEDADRALDRDEASIQRALSLIGAWKHLDDEEGPDPLDELDRIRHESKPSPPLDLDP
jgi:hypothetical protein